jgi:Methyltransferase domain
MIPIRFSRTIGTTSLAYTILCFFATSTTTTTQAFSLQTQLQELIDCYAPHHDRPSRSLLQRRHATEFPDNTPFQSFARLVCQANVVPRKELFEVWATALYLQDQFPKSRRLADLCCGHSLLSFAWMALEDDDESNSTSRTAVCIDQRMPDSAEQVARVMFQQFPEWESRWDFVEGKLDSITTTAAVSSTLLCGIHACGPLADQILALAVRGNSPLVLVPCCHSKKSLTESERELYDKNNSYDLSEFVDRCRMERLIQAGYQVEQHSIPEQFTPKNQLILAKPSPSITHNTIPQSPPTSTLPPLFSIPIDDSLESRTIIRSLSGRTAAQRRKLPPPPSFCVSLAMPQKDSVTTALWTVQAEALFGKDLTITVDYADAEAFWHASSAQYFRTFRVTYGHGDSSIEKHRAKELHERLRREIPVVPGSQVRS